VQPVNVNAAIAILNRYGRLYVYPDHILQQDIILDRGQDALAWHPAHRVRRAAWVN